VGFTGSPLSKLLGRRTSSPWHDDRPGGREIKLEA